MFHLHTINGFDKLSLMDLLQLFEDEANKKLASLVATILTALFVFFRKVPGLIGVKTDARKNVRFIQKADEAAAIFNNLAKYSGAVYVHIVRYHNGKKLKKGQPIFWDKMTVDFEMLGNACEHCITQCDAGRAGRKPVKQEWQNIIIANMWRNRVMNRTFQFKGAINTVQYNEIDAVHRSIWDKIDITCYKEVYIKLSKQEMYTLGLSFCSRFVNYAQADGMMVLAAKQLRNLI